MENSDKKEFKRDPGFQAQLDKFGMNEFIEEEESKLNEWIRKQFPEIDKIIKSYPKEEE